MKLISVYLATTSPVALPYLDLRAGAIERNVILPGDLKDLMNKVTEAKKAAEANLIASREETAAMRSQANTAKLLADNPTLHRLKLVDCLPFLRGLQACLGNRERRLPLPLVQPFGEQGRRKVTVYPNPRAWLLVLCPH